MLKSRKITVLIIILIAVIFLLPEIGQAQVDNLGTNDLANINLGDRDLKDTISLLINVALGFLGVLATLIILYGGWIWMTSQGATDKTDKAKKIILNAVIGLMIILASYAVARFVLHQIYDATGGLGGGGETEYGGGIGLGGGVIESHYPSRNATDIPRNTNIYITFKEPMNVDDLTNAVDCDFTLCASDNIVLRDTTNGIDFDNNRLQATVSADGKVFGFNPYDDENEYLGSPNGNTDYNVFLTSDIRKADGELAFSLLGYDWSFVVSNQIDLTPPTIVSVIPLDGSMNARNTVVQINFSEAVNPMYAAGIYDVTPPDLAEFDNITVVRMPIASIVEGAYTISNQYRTVEFLTDDLCGVNSCGGNVYCLPASSFFIATVTTEIRDMADNQLAADYVWHFDTNNTIDLIPPTIESMESDINVIVEAPISVTFDKSLLSSSINSSNIDFVELPATAINYWLTLSGGSQVVSINHDPLKPSTNYQPNLSSGIQDALQNCWNPCVCDDPGGSCVCDNPPCAGIYCEGQDL